MIRNERDYNRKRLLGDSGIRVQTSNIGDITAQTAVENVTIQQAIHDGDWYAATKGADEGFSPEAVRMVILRHLERILPEILREISMRYLEMN